MTGGNRKRTDCPLNIEAFQLRARRRATENPASPSRVEALFIMARRDGFRDFALHFNAYLVGQEQIFPTLTLGFRCC